MPKLSVETLLKEKKIYQIINPKCVTTHPDVSVKQAIVIMQENKSGYIVVAENNQCVGVFTETDVARKILGKKEVNWSAPIRDFMTPKPHVLSPNDPVGKAIDLMGDNRFYHVPLVDSKGNLTGVLSVRTLIRFLAEFYPNEVFNLPPDPNQVMTQPEGG
jgi:CBS domain-containing protein